MKKDLKELIRLVLSEGIHGDIETITGWAKMALAIAEKGLPDNLGDYKQEYKKYDHFHEYLEIKDQINTESIQGSINELLDEGTIEELLPYQEYRLSDPQKFSFFNRNKEVFFACNELNLGPMQLIRSKIQNFFKQHKISQEELDEVIIVATEAAENAVKYSNEFTIIISHSLENNIYKLKLFNSYSEVSLNDEINRGKFSNDVSLMRGVLVMTKLLDELDIKREKEKRRVVFFGKKTLKSIPLAI